MSQPFTDRVIVNIGWLEGRLVEGMYAHRASALKDFGALCRKRAGEAYGDGDDKRASFYRDLAKELDGLAANSRRDQAEAAKETEKWGEPVDYEPTTKRQQRR